MPRRNFHIPDPVEFVHAGEGEIPLRQGQGGAKWIPPWIGQHNKRTEDLRAAHNRELVDGWGPGSVKSKLQSDLQFEKVREKKKGE